MKRNVVLLSLAVIALLSICLPCYAVKSMMFNNVDQYIERADGIWIVEVLKQSGQEPEIGPIYEVKTIQTLKGDLEKETFFVCSISRQLTSHSRYLVFGFNRASDDGAWMDNGNISPVPVPSSLSLTELKGKPIKDQISFIISARCSEIDSLIKQLSEEKNALSECGAPKEAGEAWGWHGSEMRTWSKYVSSKRTHSEYIPLSCWDKRISELDPLCVYHHRVNIVVVLKREGDMEEGVYISNPVSSFAIIKGEEVDGFRFTETGDEGYYQFVRKRSTN